MKEVEHARKYFEDTRHPGFSDLRAGRIDSSAASQRIVRALIIPEGGAQQGRRTVWRVRNDPGTGREAARLLVLRMAGLSTTMKCKVGSRLSSRFSLLWCHGYEEFGKLLITRLRTDFPRDRLDRMEAWAKMEKPRTLRRLAISAQWLKTLVTLIEWVGTKQSLKEVNRIKRRFSHSKYPLMRFEIQ
jgi:hypothetical protein